MPSLDQDQLFQYQIKAEPPPAFIVRDIPRYESAFHQPWSEPVRFQVVPRLRVALIVSGLFAPVLSDQQQIGTFESPWHQAWSEPVRLPPRLRTGTQQFHSTFFDILPKPSNQIQGWFIHLSEPVRFKPGLAKQLQRFYEAPVRYLPPADVTMVMSPTETNADQAVFGFDVYTTPPVQLDRTALNVSVEEIVDGNTGNLSIKENES